MDLLKLIKEKSNLFAETDDYQSIEPVIRHIDIAEKHLDHGTTGEAYLFTDAIYRCNQAFEGALKAAYKTLTGKPAGRRTPYQIEQYLEESKVLRARVLSQFTNYRQAWRNASTHNHRLFFTQQEAFLAIVSVSAFFNILLDQMVEQVTYKQQKARLANRSVDTMPATNTAEQRPLASQIANLFASVLSDMHVAALAGANPYTYEYQLLGLLRAYVESFDASIVVDPEHVIKSGNQCWVADALLQKGPEQVVVEITLPTPDRERRLEDATNQLFDVLAAADITEGVLLMPPEEASTETANRKIERMVGHRAYTVTILCPASIPQNV